MKAFLVTGSFEDPRKKQPFNIEVAAEDEAAAKEKVISTIGSRHKMKRYQVHIDAVKEISGDEITDHAVKYTVEA